MMHLMGSLICIPDIIKSFFLIFQDYCCIHIAATITFCSWMEKYYESKAVVIVLQAHG
jgi:hypothetical protein